MCVVNTFYLQWGTWDWNCSLWSATKQATHRVNLSCVVVLVNMTWKYDLDLMFCPCLVFCYSFTRSQAVWRLSLSPFSFLSFPAPPSRLPSRSFSPQRRWQGPGCDPITGWLQQSPSADWFYNPHSGSQMGENQLAKKSRATLPRTRTKNYITLLDSTSMPLFLAGKKKIPINVRVCVAGERWLNNKRGMMSIHSAQVLYLK